MTLPSAANGATARAQRLYLAQLTRIGPVAFALQAHGPFGTRAAVREARLWVHADALLAIAQADPATVEQVLYSLLTAGLLDTYRLLACHPVNQRPYLPPPKAQPARPERLYSTVVPAGPANQEALLSVGADNTCRLTKPLLAAAGLDWLGYVQLVVPLKRGGQWYLDTRPKEGAGRRLPAKGKALLFRVPPIPKWLFHETRVTHGPTGAVGRPITGVTNTQVPRRYFRLGTEHPEHPGYYLLEPVAGKVGAGL